MGSSVLGKIDNFTLILLTIIVSVFDLGMSFRKSSVWKCIFKIAWERWICRSRTVRRSGDGGRKRIMRQKCVFLKHFED